MAFPHHIFCFLLKSSFTFLVQFEFLLVRETVLNMKYFEMCNKSKAEGCDFALKFNAKEIGWFELLYIHEKYVLERLSRTSSIWEVFVHL